MNWTMRNRTHLSGSYTIVGEIRGYSVWLNSGGHFGLLTREIPTLEKAKSYVESHKALQREAI